MQTIKGLNKHNYGTAIMLVIINVIIFLAQNAFKGLTEALYLVPLDILNKPYTLITSMFLHGGTGHLFFNMYALFIFGSLIEQRIGTKRFLSLYFVSGIVASLAYALFTSLILGTNTPALGASGAIMAILGMTIMLMPDLKVLFFFIIPMSLRTAGIIFVAIDILGLFVPTGIAHIAHLGGLICGLIYGYYLIKKRNKSLGKFTVPRTITITKKPKKKEKNNNYTEYSQQIEMNDEEIESYIKYGKI